MQLENTFTVPAGIDETWAAFNDPRRVAPCFPGATLESYEGDSFTGTVKVKLGPISLTYKGKGTFVERDEANHKVVIDATGRDARGNGTASAKVTGTLHPDGDNKTTVTMVTDLTVTGRPAQFGRGVMADVSDKIVGQFSSCLATKLGPESTTAEAAPATAASGGADKPAGTGTSAAAATPGTAGAASPGKAPEAGSAGVATATPTPASASSNGAGPKLAAAPEPTRGEVDAIDLLDAAGAPVLKRLAPVVLGLLVLFIVLRRIKGRNR